MGQETAPIFFWSVLNNFAQRKINYCKRLKGGFTECQTRIVKIFLQLY